MKAQFKIDFETFMEANKGSYKVYYEGQNYKNDHDLIFIRFSPISVKRPTTNCEQHRVNIRIYIFSDDLLNCDKITDKLSALLSEKTISDMEFGTLQPFRRGNKHGDTWENIVNIQFYSYGTPDASIDSLP